MATPTFLSARANAMSVHVPLIDMQINFPTNANLLNRLETLKEKPLPRPVKVIHTKLDAETLQRAQNDQSDEKNNFFQMEVCTLKNFLTLFKESCTEFHSTYDLFKRLTLAEKCNWYNAKLREAVLLPIHEMATRV